MTQKILMFQTADKMKLNNSAQVWVETVVYTLIGLSVISLLLAVVVPQIREKQDCAIIEQSKSYLLNGLSQKIEDLVDFGPGNIRDSEEMKIAKGKLTLDGKQDMIIFETDSECLYSELNMLIKEGDINILTQKKNKNYIVSLYINYTGKVNITWLGKDEPKNFPASSAPYFLMAINNGNTNNLVNIDFLLK